MSVQKTVTFKDKDAILVTLISEIVHTKQTLGQETSFSAEVTRLLSKALNVSTEESDDS